MRGCSLPRTPLRDTSQDAERVRTNAQCGEVGGGGGSVARRHLLYAQWRMPRGPRPPKNLSSPTPTGLWPGRSDPREPTARTHLFGKFVLSSGELVAALGPARLQDRSSGTGAHTVAKAMLLRPAAVVGLKCALHGFLAPAPKPGLCHQFRHKIALQRDYNAEHSSGRSPFFSPVDNLLRSRSLHPHRRAIHTLWTALWTGGGPSIPGGSERCFGEFDVGLRDGGESLWTSRTNNR